jgi:hypothetical protein
MVRFMLLGDRALWGHIPPISQLFIVVLEPFRLGVRTRPASAKRVVQHLATAGPGWKGQAAGNRRTRPESLRNLHCDQLSPRPSPLPHILPPIRPMLSPSTEPGLGKEH